jgi:hypothetical protein
MKLTKFCFQDVRSGAGNSRVGETTLRMHPNSPPQTFFEQELDQRSPSPPLPDTNNPDEQVPLPPIPPDNGDSSDQFGKDGRLQYDSDDDVTPLPDDLPEATDDPVILPKILESLEFIRMVKDATLESDFSAEDLHALRNPTPHSSTPSNDTDLLLSVSSFIDLLNSSQDAYEKMRANIQRRDPHIEMLSYSRVKRAVQDLSGIVTLKHDMCIDTCVAFTGPYAILESCPKCGKPRYDPEKLQASDGVLKVPQRQYSTFPVGPQIQARWKDPGMAEKMLYRQRRPDPGTVIKEYDDILSGEAYLEAVDDGTIGGYDTLLMFSIDGAQLYRDKKSECWIYVWILLEMAPNERYKVRNILPGGIIPGPNPPKHLESFIFPALAHVSALQKEGLKLWDSVNQTVAVSLLYVFLVLADAVAMAKLTGSVSHLGRKGCQLLCNLKGHNKPGKPHFYPAMLQLMYGNVPAPGSHPDININNLPSPNPKVYD